MGKSMNTSRWTLAVAAVLAIGAAGICSAGASYRPEPPDKTKKTTQADKDVKDVLILRSGNKVEGKIIEETDTAIKFKLVATGGIVAERTYDKADILAIERGDAAKDEKEPKTDPAPKAASGKKGEGVGDGTGSKIYMINLTGDFGRDVALTPMKSVLSDAKKQQPDILVIKIDCNFKVRGQEAPDFAADPGAFDELELARQMAVQVTDEIDQSPEWKVKPRLVFWVKKALGGVAFLPFVSKEIYYTSDAHHGGIGYLDFLFDGVGDEVVRQKQRSLRLARAIGLGLKGGHPQEILKAMSVMEYVLSVSFEGGKPVFHEDETGDILLTDDGNKEAGRRDTIDQVARFQGNDVLMLDAEMAKRLGMSSGTIDTVDQLIFALGVSRNYKIIPGKGDQAFSEWGKSVTDAEVTFRRLKRDMGRVEVKQPGKYKERTEARGRRKAILKEMLALITRYKESMNPREIADPLMSLDDWETRLTLQITEIEQEQRRDKPE
jgi:hypothetical protein